MTRATDRRIRLVMKTARHYFGLNIDVERARKIIHWDEDGSSFVSELSDNGRLDTCPRDFFGMALLDAVMPGPPTIQDGFIWAKQDRWHWPLNGSSPDYEEAFVLAWRQATEGLRAKPRKPSDQGDPLWETVPTSSDLPEQDWDKYD